MLVLIQFVAEEIRQVLTAQQVPIVVPPIMENASRIEYDVPDVQRHKHHIPAKVVAPITMFNLPTRSLK